MDWSIGSLARGLKDMRPAIVPVLIAGVLGTAIYIFLDVAHEVNEAEFMKFDHAVLLFFRVHGDLSTPIGPPWFQETVTELTSLGGYPILVAIVLAVVGYLLVDRKPGPAVFVVISVGLGTVVSTLLKLFYERPRPDLVEHLVKIHTASFPSGHATMSAVVYLTLASLILRLVDRFAVRAYVLGVAILLTVVVGVSRVYLGVHWPTDVLAGWALGAAWASLSWLVIAALRFYRHGWDSLR